VTIKGLYMHYLPSIVHEYQQKQQQLSMLGTEWRGRIVEPISDSVIHPAYYIVPRFINKRIVKPEQLSDKVFDYIFLGKGDPEKISRETGIPRDILDQIKEEFEFLYPADPNCGGKEHQTTHFPVYIMANITISPKKYWPQEIIYIKAVHTPLRNLVEHFGFGEL